MFTDYRTKKLLSTTNFPQGTGATADFGPPPPVEMFDLVREPQVYPDCGGVYDRLLSFLEDRRLFDVRTGAEFSGLSIEARQRIAAELGIPLHEFARQDAATIRLLDEGHPRWIGQRWVPSVLYNVLKKNGQEDLIWRHRIVAVPGWLFNALICEELVRMFGRAEVLRAPGFFDRAEYDEHGGYIGRSVRIDLEPHLAKQGFMRPVFNNRILTGFMVYRRPSDDRPFRLRTRTEDHSRFGTRSNFQNREVRAYA